MAAPAKPPKATGALRRDASPESELGDDADALNSSLHEVMDLMAQKTERLKVTLEYYRLIQSPDREARIRYLVGEIDRRQDVLDELKRVLLATRDDEH